MVRREDETPNSSQFLFSPFALCAQLVSQWAMDRLVRQFGRALEVLQLTD